MIALCRLGIAIVLCTVSTGCALFVRTNTTEATLRERLTELDVGNSIKGTTGVLIGPVGLFSGPEPDLLTMTSPPHEFQPCLPVTISRVLSYHTRQSYAENTFVEVQQGERKFWVERLGDTLLFNRVANGGPNPQQLSGASDGGISFLKAHILAHILKNGPEPKGIVKVGNNTVSRRDLICRDRSVFVGMSRAELLFVAGPPEKINRTVTGTSVTEQFVYVYPVKTYYYVRNGTLESWQD